MATPRPASTTLEATGLEVALHADAGIAKAIDGLNLAISRGETSAKRQEREKRFSSNSSVRSG